MLISLNQFTFALDEISIKQFYTLSTEDKNKYIMSLHNKPKEELSTMQKHILKFHTLIPVKQDNEKFISMDVL